MHILDPHNRVYSTRTAWQLHAVALIVLLGLMGLTGASDAQQPTQRSFEDTDVTEILPEVSLLRGATIHTLTAVGTLLVGDVLIEGKHIIATGPDLSNHLKARRARVIPLFGKTITPGLILPWSRIGLSNTDLGTSSSSKNLELAAGLSVARFWDSSSAEIGEAIAAGFTVAQIVPSNPGKLFSGESALIALRPDHSQLLFDTGLQTVVARLTDLEVLPAIAITQLDDAFASAQRFRSNRLAIDGGGYFDFRLSRHDLESLIRVVDDHNWIAIEAHRKEDIERLLELARNLQLRLMLYGGADSSALAEALREQGAIVILNPQASAHKGLEPAIALEAARLLNQSGVTLLFGSEQPDAPWRVRQTAGTAVSWGLPWEEALKALTLYPAQVLGLPDRGQIAPGKLAELVVWSGDPLEISSRAERVFFDGVEHHPVSKDELLALKYAEQQGVPLNVPEGGTLIQESIPR
ncbi:MAG: amidohydrolase family protein [Gammaproteobacteria bacterium]